jgi:tetratricopeptide (TPR) repeat protein
VKGTPLREKFSLFSIALLACITFVSPVQCNNDPVSETMAKATEYVQQGTVYYNQGQYEQAIEEYTKAIELKGDLAEAYLERGKAYYFYNSQYGKAIPDFNVASALSPQNEQVYYYRAWARMANGAYDKAIADFSTSIKLDPMLDRAFNGRGWAYVHKAQWSQSSILMLYQLFESDAGLIPAYKGRGWFYVKQEQWELAAAPDLVVSVEATPDIAEVYMNRGFSNFKKAQWEVALADFDKEITENPDLNRGNWDRDWIASNFAPWDTVITDYETVIEIVSGKAIPDYGVTSSGLKAELVQLALADYKKAIELSSTPELTQRAEDTIEFIREWYEDIYGE